jgi:hypothetical protein
MLTTRRPQPQKLALTSPTIGGRSVGIVRSHKTTSLFVCFWLLRKICTLEYSLLQSVENQSTLWKTRRFHFSIEEQIEQENNENQVENSVTVHATHLVHLILLYRKIAGRTVQVLGLQTNRLRAVCVQTLVP